MDIFSVLSQNEVNKKPTVSCNSLPFIHLNHTKANQHKHARLLLLTRPPLHPPAVLYGLAGLGRVTHLRITNPSAVSHRVTVEGKTVASEILRQFLLIQGGVNESTAITWFYQLIRIDAFGQKVKKN